MHAVFLAKGGRDAVRPVVAVAKLLQIRHPETVVSLITHRDHKASSASSRRCIVRFCIYQLRRTSMTINVMIMMQMWVKEVLNESTIQTVWLQSSPTYNTTVMLSVAMTVKSV